MSLYIVLSWDGGLVVVHQRDPPRTGISAAWQTERNNHHVTDGAVWYPQQGSQSGRATYDVPCGGHAHDDEVQKGVFVL